NERDVVLDLCWQNVLMPYNSQAKSDAGSNLIASADGNNETDLSRPFAVVWKGSPHCLTVWRW
ncbi:hypothetical protein FA13DRAFT_1734582, partial [Coprinellus micaceus]